MKQTINDNASLYDHYCLHRSLTSTCICCELSFLSLLWAHTSVPTYNPSFRLNCVMEIGNWGFALKKGLTHSRALNGEVCEQVKIDSLGCSMNVILCVCEHLKV